MMRSLKAGLGIVLGSALVLVGAEALAVVGRPLTPFSYAGVARRTSRRTAVVAGAAVAGSAAYIYSLPSGCSSVTINGLTYQQCGSTYYRPYYQGSELVYVPETP
ncbi:MAG TPA: hypothetical protein DFS52_24990 [Myxococcales bacterium]|jgi:hypothetical protein|nr:hypothetical protein [Myxococcales bacterium]